MSGHNGLSKFLRVNRDESVLNPKVIGAQGQYGFYNFTSGASFTPAQLLLGNVILSNGSAANISFPNGFDWRVATQGLYPNQNGGCITVRITNNANAIRNITFPGVVLAGVPAHSTSMTTADGTNIIQLAPFSAADLQICQVTPENYVVNLVGGTGAGGGTVTSIASVGAGASVVANGAAPIPTLRSIIGGNGVNATQNVNDITLDFDGVNLGAGTQLFVPGAQAGFKTITAGSGIVLTDLGTSVTITSDVTQQIAYNNSQTAGNFPMIQLTDIYKWTVGTGPTRYDTTRRAAFLDADNTQIVWAVAAPNTSVPNPGPYLLRPSRPVGSPDYSNISLCARNTHMFTDTGDEFLMSGSLRTYHMNDNTTNFLYGSVAEGRPMVRDAIPYTIIANPFLNRGDAIWGSQNFHPDDPNCGWKLKNWAYDSKLLCDNTTSAPPVGANAGGLTTWSHFGDSHGISQWTIQNIVYPAMTHFCPNEHDYALGGFTLQNGPLNGAPNPNSTRISLGKNLLMTNYSAALNQEYNGMCMEILIMAYDYTAPATCASYCIKYALISTGSPTNFAYNLQLMGNVIQQPNNPISYPPPTLSTVADPRPGSDVILTNGANGLATNRKFFYQIYVKRRDITLFNPI